MIDATIMKARAYLRSGGSLQDIAAAGGPHRNTLSGIESEAWSPTINTVRKLADALRKIEASPAKKGRA